MMIVLLGGTGYVGSVFCEFLKQKQVDIRNLTRRTTDYTDRKVLTQVLRELKPDFLINAAGSTGKPNVDACEIQKTVCLAGNAVLPGLIRTVCESLQIPWGHVSSGCIYSGRRTDGTGFSETDPPNFCFRTNHCSWYSGCKALGEECLKDAEQVFVWRLRIPFNHQDRDRNYLSKMMRYPCLLDAENSISHLNEFVDACWQCWEKRIPFGTYCSVHL